MVGVILLSSSAVFFIYGTFSPCEVLKKEIAMQSRNQGEVEHGFYLLFGGFFERHIDSLTPTQCLQKVYEIKTHGYNKTMDGFE